MILRLVEILRGTLFSIISCFLSWFIKMWNGQICHNSIPLPKLRANHLPPMMDTQAIRRWQGMRRLPISVSGGVLVRTVSTASTAFKWPFLVSFNHPKNGWLGFYKEFWTKTTYFAFWGWYAKPIETLCKKLINKVASEILGTCPVLHFEWRSNPASWSKQMAEHEKNTFWMLSVLLLYRETCESSIRTVSRTSLDCFKKGRVHIPISQNQNHVAFTSHWLTSCNFQNHQVFFPTCFGSNINYPQKFNIDTQSIHNWSRFDSCSKTIIFRYLC